MEKLKISARKVSEFFHKYINGTKGVISILLALLMTPFITIAGALVSAARINSAIAVFDEALCNASNSTLGTYDDFLRERFGLLAMSQNAPGMGESYTAEDFITDTFTFYMNENLKVLSNTYTDAEVSAAGVYPLADTDVLLSQTLEYSKYSIPTKLIIDGFDLDDLLGELTGKLKNVTNIMNTISAGVDVGQDLVECQTKLENLKKYIEDAATAKTAYNNAYTAFCNVVTSHNNLIDERNRAVAACEQAVAAAKGNLEAAKAAFTDAKNQYQWIVDQINSLKNQKDSQGRPVDNSKKIAKLEKDYEDELKTYYDAERAQRDAQTALSNAETNLANTIQSYKTKISNKRTDVKTKRNDYATKIGNLATAINNVKTGISDAQTAISDVISSGASLTKNVVGTVTSFQNDAVDKDIEAMKKSKKAAEERGDNTAAYLWDDKISEAKENKNELSNTQTVLNAGVDAKTDVIKEDIEGFVNNQTFEKAYKEIYDKLIELKGKVEKISIPTGLDKMASVTSYKYNFTETLTVQKITDMLTELVEDAATKGFLTVLKALIGFIKTLFSLSVHYDLDLTANIDKSLYSANGGLPSSMSQSSLKSSYADTDGALSSYYKQLLDPDGKVSGSNNGGTVTTIQSTVEAIRVQIDEINKERDWSGWGFFKSLGEVAIAIGKIAKSLYDLAAKIVEVIATAIYEKALLAGYIAYNVPNRCTHGDSPLTGGSYNLPNKESEKQGYAFYGAELEYIMIGGTSEKDNQKAIYYIIYGLRAILDIPFVAVDEEVASIASAAGAATFGVGTPIVYILYFLAEPLVDTLILVNGGGVPMFKTVLFLTPSGVVDLIGKFYKLKLSDAHKNTAYKQVVKIMSLNQTDEKFQQNYADAVSSGIKDGSIKEDSGLAATAKKTLEFDYTKTLLLLMMFWSSDTMLKRMADVVQMEGTYHYMSQDLKFNLAKSYTYLRASGSFTTSEFIKISESGEMSSTERVVYRGY